MLTTLSVKTGSDFCCWDEPDKLEFWLLCFWLLLWWLLLLLLYHHCDHDYSHNHLRVYCFVFAMYFFIFEIFILVFFLLKAKWTNKPNFSPMLYNGFACTLLSQDSSNWVPLYTQYIEKPLKLDLLLGLWDDEHFGNNVRMQDFIKAQHRLVSPETFRFNTWKVFKTTWSVRERSELANDGNYTRRWGHGPLRGF